MKAYERMGMKIYTNELGHTTKLAAMPIYIVKNFKNVLQIYGPMAFKQDRWPLTWYVALGTRVVPRMFK